MIQERSTKFTAFVCLITCITALGGLGGCAFDRKKTTLENLDIKSIEQQEVHSATTSRGYLASGPTIKVEIEADKHEGTIIEQFENTSNELQKNKERLSTLEKEIEKLKIINEILQIELKDSNEKLPIAQQILIENEILNSEIERLKMDLSALQKQIKQLNGNLLKAQISEVKAKQELVSARIQHLQELKASPKDALSTKSLTVK